MPLPLSASLMTRCACKVGIKMNVLSLQVHCQLGPQLRIAPTQAPKGRMQRLTLGPGKCCAKTDQAPKFRLVGQVQSHATDAITAFAQGQLLLNFCIDVGGYGILGLTVAWLILNRASWPAYFIGVFIIGIADLTFLFAMVTSGVIELNAGTVGGPVIWLLAIIMTPFGMPSLRNNSNR